MIGAHFEVILYVREMDVQVRFYRDVQVVDCKDSEGHGFFIESR